MYQVQYQIGLITAECGKKMRVQPTVVACSPRTVECRLLAAYTVLEL